MILRVFHNIEQGNQDRNEGDQHFPRAGIIFAVGRLILAIRPDLRDDKNDDEENNERNLSGSKFHFASKVRPGIELQLVSVIKNGVSL